MLCACTLSGHLFSSPLSEVKGSVVEILVDSEYPDLEYPWEIGGIESSGGSGVLIEGNRILTNAHVVDNATDIKVRRVGGAQYHDAVVAFISDERDLALLTVEDESLFDGTKPLDVGPLPDLGDEINVWGFPDGGTQIAVTRGIVSRIDYDLYTHSSTFNLVIQVDAAINVGASGGPAVVGGKIAGISFQGYDELDNVGYIIPSTVIKNFLEDAKDGKIDGVPAIAVDMHIDNPSIREYYQAGKEGAGVIISKLSGMEKEKGILREGDVILSIEDHDLSNEGTVIFPPADRIDFRYLINNHQIGDTLSIDVLRGGNALNLSYTLSYNQQDSYRMGTHRSGLVSEYLLVGGLVFQELNEDFYNAWEEGTAPAWMVQEYGEYREYAIGEDEQLIVLSSLLPDVINEGYEDFQYSRLETVNNEPVKNIEQLKSLLSKKEKVIVLGFQGGQEAIFTRKMLDRREPIIMEEYGL